VSTESQDLLYLYRVPEALWGEVSGFGLSDTGAGYEVLWGRQGLLYGAYQSLLMTGLMGTLVRMPGRALNGAR
jgi:hypothetical protein